MKVINAILLIGLLSACTSPNNKEEKSEETDHTAHAAAQSSDDSKPKSPKKMAMTNIGDNHVHIEYNSPSKRGRVIFGGLVAFGEVWSTGAHNATSINFPNPVMIGGVNIEKGKYALFTIPGKDEWIIIINRNWDQHLADDYDQAEDVVRIKVQPVSLDEPIESLTYEVKEIDETKGTITISWDNVAVSFEVVNA